jgi:hypothetical protein
MGQRDETLKNAADLAADLIQASENVSDIESLKK